MAAEMGSPTEQRKPQFEPQPEQLNIEIAWSVLPHPVQLMGTLLFYDYLIF